MSKKILIISGSPRKNGNSELLCGRFASGAEEAGNQVETVFLREKTIGYCLACDGCQRNGGTCVRNDDMADVLGKMKSADVIVMATPVYFYTMDAQMKTVIDRTYAGSVDVKDKDFYFIVTAAENRQAMLERTIEGFRGFTSCLNGATEKGIVYGIGAWKSGDIKESPAMQDAFELGQSV
ncbi:flavodoxin family protein [Brucepastera parasyntrophica]|uniref:flavodoxin family protein n=1 Tax=Brucepastera parasyntrophica TaxID=2880008 RepID=UPI00210F1852|nr:flavodoxin family protein [Brucepastera parasyntrophica]ULQ60456.1 flavodoxin family protein [Brucepastera parasyntrophica]